MTADLIFVLLALLTLVPAVWVAMSRNIVHAGFALLLTLLGAAGLYAYLGADFIAVTQVIQGDGQGPSGVGHRIDVVRADVARYVHRGRTGERAGACPGRRRGRCAGGACRRERRGRCRRFA